MSKELPALVPRLTVITLGVSDIRASIAFYDGLGFSRRLKATGITRTAQTVPMKNTKDIASASPCLRHTGAWGPSQAVCPATRGAWVELGAQTYARAGVAAPAKRPTSTQSRTANRPANAGRRGGVRQKPQNISVS